MLASKLIEDLKKALENAGDCEVETMGACGMATIDGVAVNRNTTEGKTAIILEKSTKL
jgi:hypothetical protein